MERTSGRPEIGVGLIDGPVATGHPDLAGANIREVSGQKSGCDQASSAACLHGTYIAGVLCAKRDSIAPAICPQCTILVRPIFAEAVEGMDQMPSATPEELAGAILDCIEAGARVLNLSVALSHPSRAWRAPIGRSPGLCRPAGGDRRGRGWKPGNRGQFRNYPPSMGHTGNRL